MWMTQLIAWLYTKRIHRDRNNTKSQGIYGKIILDQYKKKLCQNKSLGLQSSVFLHVLQLTTAEIGSLSPPALHPRLEPQDNAGWKGSLDCP